MRQAFVAALALSTAAAAQITVVPSAAATVRPSRSPFWQSNTFYAINSTTIAPASRSQCIVDCADIAAPAALWNSLEVRRPFGLGNANPAITTAATIIMSVSASPWQSATNNFTTNHGVSPVTVLNTQISLPAASNPGAWPAPWQTPFPFSTPFPYAGISGGSLVIDIHQDQTATPQPTSPAPWYLEYTTPDNGGLLTVYYQNNCRFSNGNPANGVSYSSIILPGSNWGPTYSNILPNAPGLGVIGAYGPGQSWIGIPLPFDLTPLGAPGCGLYSSIEISQALAANASGSASWPTLQIPNDPALGGSDFYAHSIWIDLAANSLGIVTGYGGKWHIGNGLGAPSAYLSATGNAHVNATGTLQRGGCTTFQLQ